MEVRTDESQFGRNHPKREYAGVNIASDELKFERRRPIYVAQIETITRKLDSGVSRIKEGHRVARLNSTSSDLERPLTYRQRARLVWNLQVLQYRLENGHAQRWDDGLSLTFA